MRKVASALASFDFRGEEVRQSGARIVTLDRGPRQSGPDAVTFRDPPVDITHRRMTLTWSSTNNANLRAR